MKSKVVIIMLVLLSFFMSILLYLVSFFVNYKYFNKNKLLSFESGFTAVSYVHLSFSIHFFIILVMFVIFDLEIILLLGCLVSNNNLTYLLFILLVVGGVYLEWYLGKLKWMI